MKSLAQFFLNRLIAQALQLSLRHHLVWNLNERTGDIVRSDCVGNDCLRSIGIERLPGIVIDNSARIQHPSGLIADDGHLKVIAPPPINFARREMRAIEQNLGANDG